MVRAAARAAGAAGRAVGRRKAAGAWRRGSSTLHHSAQSAQSALAALAPRHRRVWRADGRVSFSPRRLSVVRGRMRGRGGAAVTCCGTCARRRWHVARRTRAVPRRPPDRTRRHAPLARACGCPCCRCSCCRSCSRARQQVSYTLFIITTHTTHCQ